VIVAVLSWWLASSLLGIVALPIIWRLFSKLPDRGYGFSRAFGVIAAGYILWLGASLGAFRNSLGGALTAILVVAGLALGLGYGQRKELLDWIRANWRMVVVMELLFLIAFVFWAFVRANNPELEGTEKPMEIAFLNAILRSERFPPNDPWLSGYAISYYYFGYVLLALLTRITNVSSSVAFNLGSSLWFAFSVLGAYALLYNLISARQKSPRLTAPLLGPLFVVISGNLEGFLEFLHARHIFWSQDASGVSVSSFWTWLNLENLLNPPLGEMSWVPNRHWWWWRASRVIRDINLHGESTGIEPIDEFPFFSFLLADNHPHVLALPFILMAVAFALNIFLAGKSPDFRLGGFKLSPKLQSGAKITAALAILLLGASRIGIAALTGLPFSASVLEGLRVMILACALVWVLSGLIRFLSGELPSALPKEAFWFGAWLFGGLLFLNTWDFPIYFSLLLVTLWWTGRSEAPVVVLKRLGLTAVGLTVMGVLFYLPWYPGFASQAGGILPNMVFSTRLPHFLVMFSPAFIPIVLWMIGRIRRGFHRAELAWVASIGVGVPLMLMLLSWALGIAMAVILNRQDPVALSGMLNHIGSDSVQGVFRGSLMRLLTRSWTSWVLGLLIAAVMLVLMRVDNRSGTTQEGGDTPWPFVVLLIGIGALLVLGPEYLYLRDQFGSRMNTIFKFYFAAWNLWGIAAAYATYALWSRTRRMHLVWAVIAIIPVLLGMFYPLMATVTKTAEFSPPNGRTLDGVAFISLRNPDDYIAMQYINTQLTDGVLVEAVGGSYTYFGRMSAFTGVPTVLGWPGHESQWRGGYVEMGSRQADIDTLYRTRYWDEAIGILDRYAIDYVYVGALERISYEPLYEQKFEAHMDLIFQYGEARIFARRGEATP
jgi:uncharacterized membrane protein